MTEQDRQAKIAHALQKTAADIESLKDLAFMLAQHVEALDKRAAQLERLAQEFEAGRYLPKDTDATADPDLPALAGAEAPP